MSNAASFTVGDLLVARTGAVATITLNRPEKLNTLRNSFWPDMRTVLARLETDPETRVLILTGAGDRAFCAGGDINGFAELADQEARRTYQIDAMRTFKALEDYPLPTIAAVNGLALGGGCELTLACDMVLAASTARFAMPEARLGLVPGYGVLRAPHVIGRQLTKMMVMSGDDIDAQTALRYGLVQQVVPAASLMETAHALAQRIAGNSPLAHAVGKKLINRGIDSAEWDYSVEALTVLQGSEEATSRVRAFLNRKADKQA